jgi:hypothetical protein
MRGVTRRMWNFDMVDYDARKYFTCMKIKGLRACNPPYNLFPLSKLCTLSPYAAPSTGGFIGNSPKGRGKEAALCQRDREVPFGKPR